MIDPLVPGALCSFPLAQMDPAECPTNLGWQNSTSLLPSAWFLHTSLESWNVEILFFFFFALFFTHCLPCI